VSDCVGTLRFAPAEKFSPGVIISSYGPAAATTRVLTSSRSASRCPLMSETEDNQVIDIIACIARMAAVS
jgi:hypothetical protein